MGFYGFLSVLFCASLSYGMEFTSGESAPQDAVLSVSTSSPSSSESDSEEYRGPRYEDAVHFFYDKDRDLYYCFDDDSEELKNFSYQERLIQLKHHGFTERKARAILIARGFIKVQDIIKEWKDKDSPGAIDYSHMLFNTERDTAFCPLSQKELLSISDETKINNMRKQGISRQEAKLRIEAQKQMDQEMKG